MWIPVTAFDQLKQTLNDASREARRLARSRRSGTVNVASRRNIKVVSNIGRSGAVERVTTVQNAQIHQSGTFDDDHHAA
jgi:hypothetical protein